ncbi:MAG: hypothetical protein ABJB86_05585 [Bacteroidota bacterium]
MEENIQTEDKAPVQIRNTKEILTEVVTVRNAKEYLGESLLIIFSVVLALLLTELFNKIHENSRASEILQQLREELVNNKNAEQIQYHYCQGVLKRIDSALTHPAFARQFIDSGVINLKAIAPYGVSTRDLSDVAWQVAKQNNIISRLDQNTYTLLADIYEQQRRSTKLEEEVAKILLSWESRNPENLRTTLILTGDNYHGWAVDRAPALLVKYQQAIDKLSHF